MLLIVNEFTNYTMEPTRCVCRKAKAAHGGSGQPTAGSSCQPGS